MRRVLLICVLLAVAQTASAQTKPLDVQGWQSLRWGMTEDEAAKAAESSGLKLTPKDRREDRGRVYLPFESSVALYDSTYLVRFFFLRHTQN